MTISLLRKTSFLFLSILIFLLAACGGQTAANSSAASSADSGQSEDQPARISVSGAFALFPIVSVWTEEYSKLHPDITFDVQAGGAGKGMTDMLTGAADMWALFAQGEAQEDLTGTAVNADPGLAEAVRQDPLGVGYNNIGFAYDQATGAPVNGLQIIPIDLNGNGRIDADEDFYANRADLIAAIAAEVYPFPPARVLFLVTKGEPDPAVVDFYRWVLTDGQAFVPQAGYVALTEDRIQEALFLLPE
jgi:ABC-type phosphate transport system substrate-binding protein